MNDWIELENNTTSTWTTCNGVYGWLFTAFKGNSLFLPAAGYRWINELDDLGEAGYYWSSELASNVHVIYSPDLDTCGSNYAINIEFHAHTQYFLYSWNKRFYGYSIRAVRSAR